MTRVRKKKAPTAIDLFSGCGGLTLGLKQAGFCVIGAVELDELAAETYVSNHPEVHLWQTDIRKVTGAQVRKMLGLRRGQLDLLAGCPPCQGFSSMRTRNGKKQNRDKRNDLIFDYLRMVKALRPKTVMMENVPALIENERLKVLEKALREMGYKFSGTPTILNAADFGVPQRRKRMILIGSRVRRVIMPPLTAKTKTVRETIEALDRPRDSSDPLHNIVEERNSKIAHMIALIPKNGGSRTDLPAKYHLPCHKKLKDGFKDVYGRMKWDEVSPTITGGCVNPSKGRFLHPRQNRAITLREAAMLQTFPRGYRFSLKRGKYAVALMIGNALPPAFIKKHAMAIKDALPLVKRRPLRKKYSGSRRNRPKSA